MPVFMASPFGPQMLVPTTNRHFVARGYLVANGLSRGTNGHTANRVLLANTRPCGSNGGAAIGVPWQSGGPAARTNLWQTMAHGN